MDDETKLSDETDSDIKTNPNPIDTNPVEGSPVSSMTAFSTCVEIVSTDEYTKHPCYEILKSGRRGNLKNMHFRVQLLTNILELSPNSFLQPSFCSNSIVKHWYKKYTLYLKFPRKCNCVVMAAAICELDLLLENSNKMVDSLYGQKEIKGMKPISAKTYS